MAGSPVYEGASETQKLGLNHLWWVAFYQAVKTSEIHTILYNQLCANAFFKLKGFEVLCHELDLETSQERYHVDAFQHIGEHTEMALLGFPLFARPFATADVADKKDTAWLIRRLGGDQVASLFVSKVSKSPFVASQYLLMRGFFNAIAKHKERLAFQLHKQRLEEEKPVPAPLAIVHYPYPEEAFHMATSHLISHDLYKDFPKPSRLDVLVLNLMVYFIQKKVFSHYGSVIAGALGNDAVALPQAYRILRSKLFGFSHPEAMHMLEECFCKEHQGFHESAALMEQIRASARRSMADIDYLWKVNREMSALEGFRVEDALKRNRKSFRAFAVKAATG